MMTVAVVCIFIILNPQLKKKSSPIKVIVRGEMKYKVMEVLHARLVSPCLSQEVTIDTPN